MAGQTGRSFKMAFAKLGASSWGVPAAVDKGLYFTSDAIMQFKPAQITDPAFGQTFLGQAQSGLVESVTGGFTGQDRYEAQHYWWEALAMGSPATVAISTSASGQTTSWLHVTDLATSTDGLALCAAIDKVLFVDELTSAKVTGFEMTEGDNGVMDITFNVLGSKPTNISSTNTRSTVADASYPSLGNRVLQPQGVFRMNVNSGSALAAGDALTVESVKFSFERPQDAPHVYGQDYITEPADNGFPEFTVELTYPRMNTVSATSLYNGLRAATAFKADWTFTSGLYINSTDPWKKILQWPYLQLMDDGWSAPAAGAEQVKPKAKFAARLAPTSPSGMAFVNPFRLQRIQQNSTKPF